MSSTRHRPTIGPGTVVALGLVGAAIVLLVLGRLVEWDPTWRALGVTPLQPPFFDMHVLNDYAACAWKGADAYAPHACNVDSYNIPAMWLWLGFLGVDGSDSSWLSAAVIAAAVFVMVLFLQRRPWFHGTIRVGSDDFSLCDDGCRARQYRPAHPGAGRVGRVDLRRETSRARMRGHCISLFWRRVEAIPDVLRLARGPLEQADLHLRDNIHLIIWVQDNFSRFRSSKKRSGVKPIGLADTRAPASIAALVLICAATVAVHSFRNRREFCSVGIFAAGAAFLCGAGIYCGTYLLGTNFIYRLMFLLLCIPQLLDWQIQRNASEKSAMIAELGLLGTVFGVLLVKWKCKRPFVLSFAPAAARLALILLFGHRADVEFFAHLGWPGVRASRI